MAVVKPDSLRTLPEPFRQKAFEEKQDCQPVVPIFAQPDSWLLSDGASERELTTQMSLGTNGVVFFKGQIPSGRHLPENAVSSRFYVDQVSVHLRVPFFASLSARPVPVRTPFPEDSSNPSPTPYARRVPNRTWRPS
jgi:hypothetical protein